MHQLKRGIRSNRAEGSPWHFSLECLAVRASPHDGVAILSHHGPPEPLLSKSQGPLLALMAGIPMYPVKCRVALSHGMTKASTPSVSPFRVVLMYIRPLFWMRLSRIQKNILPCSVSASAPRYSFSRVSCLGGSIPFLRQSHLRHLARATSTSWACSQSTMCISSSFAA